MAVEETVQPLIACVRLPSGVQKEASIFKVSLRKGLKKLTSDLVT